MARRTPLNAETERLCRPDQPQRLINRPTSFTVSDWMGATMAALKRVRRRLGSIRRIFRWKCVSSQRGRIHVVNPKTGLAGSSLHVRFREDHSWRDELASPVSAETVCEITFRRSARGLRAGWSRSSFPRLRRSDHRGRRVTHGSPPSVPAASSVRTFHHRRGRLRP